MKSETALVAARLRHQQWISDIRECNSRPAGVTVADWCAEHQISKNTYYYHMRALRAACLDYSATHDITDEASSTDASFVELRPCIGHPSETMPSSVIIRIGNASIELSDAISDDFLKRIVGVVSHA